MLRLEGSNGLKAVGELLPGSKGLCGLWKGWAVCLEWPLAREVRNKSQNHTWDISHPTPHKWQFKSQSQPSSDICFPLNTPRRSLLLMKNTTRKIECSHWGAMERQQG